MSSQTVSWKDFSPPHTSREREQTEWSITYAYRAPQTDLPRVLLIGDSICNAYQAKVRELLEDQVNVSFWASSKCVTDPDYFRELDFILDARPYQMITFNNGLHSLHTDREEWDAAYAAALSFMRAKLPQAKLALVLSTPLSDEALTGVSASLNETVLRLAAERKLPVIDLFAPMEALDRTETWTDGVHFQPAAVDIQAGLLASQILRALV